jgi:hypothetical protein
VEEGEHGSERIVPWNLKQIVNLGDEINLIETIDFIGTEKVIERK